MIILAALAVFALTGIVALIILEERGRPEIAVLIVLGLVVFDALLYPSQAAVPPGILHPTIMGHDYRVPDLVIPLALIARLVVRGLPRRVTGTGLLWFVFFATFAFSAFLGTANGHTSTLVIFQTKFVIEAGGMAILASGVRSDVWTSPVFIGRAAWVLGLVSLGPIAMGAVGRSVSLPILAQASLGRLGADAATVLVSFGFVLLLVEVCGASPRPGVIAWCGVMIVSPIFTGQRAALIGMVVTLMCGVVVLVGRPWRRRSRMRLTHLVPIVAFLVIPLGTIAVLELADQLERDQPPRSEQSQQPVHRRGQDAVGRHPPHRLGTRPEFGRGAARVRLGPRPGLQYLPAERIGGSVHRRRLPQHRDRRRGDHRPDRTRPLSVRVRGLTPRRVPDVAPRSAIPPSPRWRSRPGSCWSSSRRRVCSRASSRSSDWESSSDSSWGSSPPRCGR